MTVTLSDADAAMLIVLRSPLGHLSRILRLFSPAMSPIPLEQDDETLLVPILFVVVTPL